MSVFTEKEIDYLAGQRLGRIAIPAGGKAFGERFEDTIVRIRPTRIIAFGIDPGDTANSRSVSAT
jgi:hypothetical protein